jgi:hypothetical protein
MADCNGRSLRKVALIERKAMLAESLKANPIPALRCADPALNTRASRDRESGAVCGPCIFHGPRLLGPAKYPAAISADRGMCAPRQGNFKKIRRGKRLLNEAMLRMNLAVLDCPPVPRGPFGRT